MKRREDSSLSRWISTISTSCLVILLWLVLATVFSVTLIQEAHADNASNPLANVRNTDLRWQYKDLGDDTHLNDVYLDGSWPFQPTFKLKYELHYQETDVTGSSENDWESLHLKPIYFPKKGEWGKWKYGVAIGLEWIVDFDNTDKGIGSGADQLAPLIGVSLTPRPGTTLVPLLQQFWSYSGEDVNLTSLRQIGIQSFPRQIWGKLDAKMSFDHENDTVPASLELQLGKMLSKSFGLYVDGLIGLGGDRDYDHGIGLGLRLLY